ncbi:unnamed protein product, partial [marine sediment metagenome]
MNEILSSIKRKYSGNSVVKHIAEVLYLDIGPDQISHIIKKPLYGLKVAAFYGCHLVRPSEIMNFDDPSKCIYCGECVILCPYNAFKLEVNDKESIPSIDLEAFPTLIKEIEVDVKKCIPDCKLACQEGCPFEA